MARGWVLVFALLSVGAPSGSLADEPDRPAPIPGEVEVRGKKVMFHWRDIPDAKGYRVQVGRSLLFMPRTAEARSARNSVELKNLPNGQLYWRVAGTWSDGDGPFSPAQLL